MHIFLLNIDWIQPIMLLLGGGTVGAVVGPIIQWIRNKKKDSAEQGKIDAETEKLRAEAVEIKAKAEVTVAEAALKLAQRLSEDCEATRKELERTQHELTQTISQLDEVTRQLRGVQNDLITERRRAEDNFLEIEKLRNELSKLSGNDISKE